MIPEPLILISIPVTLVLIPPSLVKGTAKLNFMMGLNDD